MPLNVLLTLQPFKSGRMNPYTSSGHPSPNCAAALAVAPPQSAPRPPHTLSKSTCQLAVNPTASLLPAPRLRATLPRLAPAYLQPLLTLMLSAALPLLPTCTRPPHISLRDAWHCRAAAMPVITSPR